MTGTATYARLLMLLILPLHAIPATRRVYVFLLFILKRFLVYYRDPIFEKGQMDTAAKIIHTDMMLSGKAAKWHEQVKNI